MKIEDILLENDTLKEVDVDGLKPEERLGSRIGNWLKKKFTTDPIADNSTPAVRGSTRGAGPNAPTTTRKSNKSGQMGRGARNARRGDPTTSAVAKLQTPAYNPKNVDDQVMGKTSAVAKTKKTPTPMDAGEFAGTPTVAKTKKTPTPMDAGEFAGTPTVAKTKKTPTPMDAGEFASAASGKEATLDNTPKPASIVARDKYAGRDTNRGLAVGRGRDMSNADAIAQAGAKFTQNTPVAKTSKYPKGDIRNLGKYIKPANVTNQGGKKMAGDVEAPKKGADLRNLLKLAGVNRPDGSAKDNK